MHYQATPVVTHLTTRTLTENRQALLKILDQVVKMEITREDVLEQSRCEVDTTTPTSSPSKLKMPKKGGGKATAKKPKIAAGKGCECKESEDSSC